MKMNMFSERNLQRCESPTGFNHLLASWSLYEWITAVMGELGESANIIKKLKRARDDIPGNNESPELLREMLADELADTYIYLDLLIQAAGLDTEAIVGSKFRRTSVKIGYEDW